MRNAPASTGPAFNAATIATALSAADGTIAITGLPYRGDGIVVAIPGYSIVLPARSMVFRDIVATWINRVAGEVIKYPAPFFRPRYFGSWVDTNTGNVYFDIVEVFSRENREDAIAAGATRGQIAIWDNGRQELIDTGAVD